MINQYKRTDVFRCNYETHSKFENRVSVYHVLKSKKCWPTGCISFKWKCKLLNKGKRCIKGYQYIGKKCTGCSYYYDIKIHNQPVMILSTEAAEQFWEDLGDFEDWLDEIRGKELSVFGKIFSVKPHFKKEVFASRENFHISGYSLIFQSGFFETTPFEDYFYANIHPSKQNRHQFAIDDEVEFRGFLDLDRGRIIFRRIRQVEFNNKSNHQPLTLSDVLVARQTATHFNSQPNKCLHCQFGVLVDVTDNRTRPVKHRRELYCLKGIREPDICVIPVFNLLDDAETSMR